MDTPILIKPVSVYGGQATACVMGSYNIYPTPDGTSASTNITLGNVVDEKFQSCADTRQFSVAMTPEQYAKWGEDDAYAQNVFLENAGLEQA